MEKNILIKQQSGFRKFRQTGDNIILLTQRSQQGFNESKKTLAIFFDIAAAFDKVWHDGLVYKLVKIKLPYYLVKIVQTFLADRKFSVKVGDKTSTLIEIKTGVPQGAVLSPTLFNIFINDAPMRNIINLNNDQKESTCLFADDLAYMISFKNKEKDEAKNKAQFYLDELNEWVNKWRLSIAPHKSSYIVFSRYKKGGTQEKFEIHLDGKMIPEEKAPKFLGIKFDKFLSFKNQVENIKNKAYSRMSILKIMSYDKHMRVNEKVLLRLYKSLTRFFISLRLFN